MSHSALVQEQTLECADCFDPNLGGLTFHKSPSQRLRLLLWLADMLNVAPRALVSGSEGDAGCAQPLSSPTGVISA